MGVLKAVGGFFLAGVLFAAIGVGLCEANKAYWDHRVRELCEKDGGVTVYQRVELSPAQFTQLKGERGQLVVPFDWETKRSLYYLRSEKSIVLKNYPRVSREELQLLRREDGKLLATQINYQRRGGDFPFGIIETTHFGCENLSYIELDLIGSTISEFKEER